MRTLIVVVIAIALGPTIAFATQFREPKAVRYNSARIARYSTGDLIDLLSEPSFDENGIYEENEPYYVRAIKAELAKRGPVDRLAAAFAQTDDPLQRRLIFEVLVNLRSAPSLAALRSSATQQTEEANYLANLYFAQRCDTAALANLNANYGRYSVSSLELASVAKAFGDCDYKAAVPNLVRSVDAASLNLGGAAHLSLQKIYPHAKIDAPDPETAKKSWQHYLTRHR